MTRNIKTVTVIGAGAMGGGIAAHLANAGVKVHLLNIAEKGINGKVIAHNRIQEMKKALLTTDPLNAGFMDPDNADLITPGSQEDDLEKAVGESDWVIEVIIENLRIKRDLFEKIDRFKKPDTIVTSNTSTIPLHDLTEGRSDDFTKNFAITHFFNPPRIMRLLELVKSEKTDPEVTQTLRDFCDVRLGKTVIDCNDRPGFIANRIGSYFMFRAISEAMAQGIPAEDVDAVLGKPLNLCKDGVFKIIDQVGLGLTPHVAKSLLDNLPPDDAFCQIDSGPAMKLINGMVADGRTGYKSPLGGFYRMLRNEDGSKIKQVIDLQTGDYHAVSKKPLEAVSAGKDGPRAVLEGKDKLSAFAWTVMRDTLLYAATLVPEISDDISAIDAAMREGYNWKQGPFQLMDRIGVDWFAERLQDEGLDLPPALTLANGHPFYLQSGGKTGHLAFDFDIGAAHYKKPDEQPGILNLADIKNSRKPVLKNASASVWDIGDGVLCFEFRSKMNSLDPSIMLGLNETIKLINGSGGRYKALVIYNDEKNFSAGANLGILSAGFQLAQNKVLKALHLSGLIERGLYKVAENLVYEGQAVYKALREAPFPVVGAPSGTALGGGCEILLHCDAVQANAETYMALVESGVGVIPGWGGNARMLERFHDAAGIKRGPFPPLRQTFMALMKPQDSLSASAQDARKKLWLRSGDGITMNRDRLLADAKSRALSMVHGYKPPAPVMFRLPGVNGLTAIRSAVNDLYATGQVTYHDVVVADALASTLTGGNTHIGKALSDADLAQLERENFISLLKTPETRARINFMLSTGKPLREGPLEPPQTLEAIRAHRESVALPRRLLDGKPLSGPEETTLRRMAKVTAFAMKYLA